MDKKNVTVGMRRSLGGVFRAVAGTSLPNDASTALASAFKDQGYIGEDGITKSHETETTEIKDMNGVTVREIKTSGKSVFKFKALEVLNIETLKSVYGSSNVSGALSTGITVLDKPCEEPEESVWAIDLVTSEKDLVRYVIPRGLITDLGDEVIKSSEGWAFDITLTCLPDDTDVSVYEYIKAGPTGATGASA